MTDPIAPLTSKDINKDIDTAKSTDNNDTIVTQMRTLIDTS